MYDKKDRENDGAFLAIGILLLVMSTSIGIIVYKNERAEKRITMLENKLHAVEVRLSHGQ